MVLRYETFWPTPKKLVQKLLGQPQQSEIVTNITNILIVSCAVNDRACSFYLIQQKKVIKMSLLVKNWSER